MRVIGRLICGGVVLAVAYIPGCGCVRHMILSGALGSRGDISNTRFYMANHSYTGIPAVSHLNYYFIDARNSPFAC